MNVNMNTHMNMGTDANTRRLLKAVPHHTRDALHTKLAEVYTANRQYDEALESFHFAIRCAICI